MPEQPPGGARPVLVVHGLWMTGVETVLLRRRLRAHGFEPVLCRYASTRESADVVLARLARRAEGCGGPFHAIGHSLGGVLLLRLFAQRPELPLARCVLLGSPAAGSRAARRIASLPLGRSLLGPLASDGLTGGRPLPWRHRAPLGVIAGTRALGLGRLVAALPGPNDGAVAVDETRVDGVAEHLELPVSHTGMLFSATVARASAHFLATGGFGRHAPRR
jgi:pimeloyl-ACP methyl ester carboxylesterase